MINTETASNTDNQKHVADELARIAAYTDMLGQLCELSPNPETLSLEQLEVIFKDIAQVCAAGAHTIKKLG